MHYRRNCETGRAAVDTPEVGIWEIEQEDHFCGENVNNLPTSKQGSPIYSKRPYPLRSLLAFQSAHS
jgi:hypothetical protein